MDNQGLSQDLETGCHKLAILKLLGILFYQGRLQYTQITSINLYLLSKRIIIQCHDNYIKVKEFNMIGGLKLTFKEITHKKIWVS